MSEISVNTAAMEAADKTLSSAVGRIEASNRHRSAAQAGLIGGVGDSYDALRRALYRDGFMNESAINVLSKLVGRYGTRYGEAEEAARLGYLKTPGGGRRT